MQLSLFNEERQDMAINTMSFNTEPGQVIPIDDINLEDIMHYIHTPEESRLKENIWMQ